MTASTTAPCCEPSELTCHPLLGLKTTAERLLELDRRMADPTLSNRDRRETIAQIRAMIRAGNMHLADMFEASFQRDYLPLAD